MDIFAIQSTCMEVSVSLSCLFVHEPLYQTTVVCCNAVFHRGSSRMDHCTVFHIRVGLAQARPNKYWTAFNLPNFLKALTAKLLQTKSFTFNQTVLQVKHLHNYLSISIYL